MYTNINPKSLKKVEKITSVMYINCKIMKGHDQFYCTAY